MAVTTSLTAALKKLVLDLEGDLRQRVESQPEVRAQWYDEHAAALTKHRTSAPWQAWRDDRVTQAAVSWVLTTVFVRFCEDNRLVEPVWFTGPGDLRQQALDAELAYFRTHPDLTDRAWIEQAVRHLRTVPATRDLVESHTPLWTVSPSGEAAKRIRDFWRQQTADGAPVWDFADPELSTRFLGDLYQDLSEYAKKTFALLQTPVFVEEFILDQTMEPALAERSLEGFTLIDPTCGSGHFLLGAFDRLVDKWAEHDPSLDAAQRTTRALAAVHGVDINPFAVAIARFRLIVAAMKSMGLTSFSRMPELDLNLVSGDSLIFGRLGHSESFDGLGGESDRFGYSSEDVNALWQILAPGRHDVVVGNPPYITVKDKELNQRYRDLYPKVCKGKYPLTAPFMERFFDLARRDSGSRPAGWVGQITSNSFMKREFGSKIIEDFLPKQDLRLVVDTSGAYIPGHGTPTVILVGSPRTATGGTVRAVLGIRGEPGQPIDPAEGVVWRSIVHNVQNAGYEGEYVSVVDLEHTALSAHPWSLSGGGAVDVSRRISSGECCLLQERIESIGFAAVTGEDGAFLTDGVAPRAWHSSEISTRGYVDGESVRDYGTISKPALFPYDERGRPSNLEAASSLWPLRTTLRAGLAFGRTREDAGKKWFEYILPNWPRLSAPKLITFAFVATHNHFVLDRGGKVFKQSAPVIKLPAGATEDEHLELLGVLNSSTACFWLKQNSHNKGNGGIGGGIGDEAWEPRYEFTGTTLQDFPLPSTLPLERGRRMDGHAQRLASHLPASIGDDGTPTEDDLAAAAHAHQAVREVMIAEQEELDWECYRLYGLLGDDLTYPSSPPQVRLGERAFEIALARATGRGEVTTTWFERHGSTPTTEIPERWPDDYRSLVQRRLDAIEDNPHIRLLEKPEYKRRWAMEPWDKQVDRALRGWLLDRLEDRRYWFDGQGRPTARSVAQLADVAARDTDLVSVLRLWARRPDLTVTVMLSSLLDGEAVPYLAALRYKEAGLRKREAWEQTWDLQRREDAGEDVGVIPVPPKYTTADFQKQSYWSHRGKLDVPKERFILYPAAGRLSDPTALLGWAGWDHAQQALALATIIGEREQDGWTDDDLVPLVAGLAELTPWVRQWHDELDPTFGLNLADLVDEQLRTRTAQVGKTANELHAWRPAPTRRGGRRAIR